MPKSIKDREHQKATITSLSSWLELEAAIKLVEACTLRGDLEEAELHRERASALLVIRMDAKQATIALVRHAGGITDGKPK